MGGELENRGGARGELSASVSSRRAGDAAALLTTGQMYAADRAAISGGIAGTELMENAGRAVAGAIIARWPRAGLAVVLCGPGNNGGDGFVIARLLREAGFPVRLGLLGAADRLSGDAAAMAARWQGGIEPLTVALLDGAALIVDALFGAGLARPLEGAALQVLAAAHNLGAPIIAVDMPSGVEGTGGQVLGFAPHAALTVTFFRKKCGHLLMPGRAHCGEVLVADIGIPDAVLESLGAMARENAPRLWLDVFPRPRADGHKYDRGHCVVKSGPLISTGAARLAARGALRAGAGLVTVASPPDALAVNAAHLTAIMLAECSDAGAFGLLLADARRNAVLLGPGNGVGADTRKFVEAALASGAAVVLDADALTSFESGAGGQTGAEDLFAVIRGRRGDVVLTPHEGEFGRLFPQLRAGRELEADGFPVAKTERAARAASESGAVVVLKGADSVIAAPDGRLAINGNGSPYLASAGSGDVLAGIITGLIAQGMPGFEAACAGCWLHGEAARNFGPGLIAEDLPDMLPRIMADWSSAGFR